MGIKDIAKRHNDDSVKDVDEDSFIRLGDAEVTEEEYDILCEITGLYKSTPEDEYLHGTIVVKEGIEELKLPYRNLSHVPESISKLTDLKRLHLGGNFLDSIPDSITNLDQLQELNIRFNQIEYLPKDIGKMKTLKKLDAYKNKLYVLPESIIDLSNLEYLNFDYNYLLALPEDIGRLGKLKALYLMYNSFTEIPESIKDLSLIEEISLEGNELKTSDEKRLYDIFGTRVNL